MGKYPYIFEMSDFLFFVLKASGAWMTVTVCREFLGKLSYVNEHENFCTHDSMTWCSFRHRLADYHRTQLPHKLSL